MSKPRILDLFSCAGGAAMGYHRAGFDVVGVDIATQPNYPFEFHQGDALAYLAEHGHEFDAIHASPPCQDHSVTSSQHPMRGTAVLLDQTRQALLGQDKPWVIENVPGAPMRTDYRLCGCMFDLPGLRRERWFETSWHGFEFRSACRHTGRAVTVTGHPGGRSTRDGIQHGGKAVWEKAMGIDWMTARELAQAIPPAYTHHIGAQLMTVIQQQAVAA